MRHDQCWAIAADGLRCGQPSTFGDDFCILHGFGSRPKPSQIWREPVCEMPPGLVVQIRADDPDAVFPEPPLDPGFLTPEEPSPPAPALLQTAPAPEPAPPASPCTPADPEESPLAWLQAQLRTAIEGVMAGEATPLQKANAVSRLGNLYLKAHRAAELQRENRQLTRRVAELETQLVTAEAEAARQEPRISAPAFPRPGAPSLEPHPDANGRYSAGPPVGAARGTASPSRRSRKR